MNLIHRTAVYVRVKRAYISETVEHWYVLFFETFPEVKKWWFWLILFCVLGGLVWGARWGYQQYLQRYSPAWAEKELQNEGYTLSPDDFIKAVRSPDQKKLMPLFWQAKVDVNRAGSDGIRPLWVAVDTLNYELTQKLIEKGARVDITDGQGKQILEFAVEKGSLPIFNLIYGGGATNTIVNFALLTRFADRELLKKLIEEKYPSSVNLNGRWKVPHELIEEGGFLRYNIRQKDADGMEPIHWAAARGDPGIIDLLVEKGASFDVIDSRFNQTPLIIASIAGNESAVQRLTYYKADMNVRDSDGKSALFYAIVRNHPAVVNQLLKAGADPDVRESKGGITAVSIAAYMNHPTILSALIDAGADVTKQDYQGLAAMDWAAFGGNIQTVEILWDKSSIVYTENKKFVQSALRIARDGGKSNVIDYLEKIAR